MIYTITRWFSGGLRVFWKVKDPLQDKLMSGNLTWAGDFETWLALGNKAADVERGGTNGLGIQKWCPLPRSYRKDAKLQESSHEDDIKSMSILIWSQNIFAPHIHFFSWGETQLAWGHGRDDQTPNKSNSRKEGLVLAYSLRAQSILEAGAWSSPSHCIDFQKGDRWRLVLNLFSPLYLVWDPAHGMALPTVRVFLVWDPSPWHGTAHN